MKRTTYIAAIAAAAVGLTTLSAMARERGPDFATLDADGNGEVTLSELQARGDARFETADTDGDGFLSLAELEAAGQERAGDRAARLRAAGQVQVTEHLSRQVGKTHRVLMESPTMGRTEQFCEVVFETAQDEGAIVTARIRAHADTHLVA